MKKICLIIFIVLGAHLNILAPNIPYEWVKDSRRITVLQHLDFSYENFKEYLTLRGIKYQKIIVKQAILETGYFTSLVFTVNNNLFGMRHPRIRNTVSLGSNLNHAKYRHWTDSVEDYILWQDYHNRLIEDCYYTFLKKVGYATDTQYTKKLKTIDTMHNLKLNNV